MKRNKFIVTLLLFCMVAGILGFAFEFSRAVSQKETANMEFARDTGYKQGCVETYHSLGMISDSDYNSYLEASDKYDKEPSKKNLENSSELVNRLLRSLAM